MALQNGFNVGTVLGIRLVVHPSWFLIVAVFTAVFGGQIQAEYKLAGGGQYFFGFVAAILLYACILAHELGHALAARSFGIATERIALNAFGGLTLTQPKTRTPAQEFLIAGAGPLVTVLCAIAFAVPLLLPAGAKEALSLDGPLGAVVMTVAIANVMLAIFNLMPGFPMDGGFMLRAVLAALVGDHLKATTVACWLGRGFGILWIGLGVVLLFVDPLSALLAIAPGWLIVKAAGMVQREARMTAAIASVRVRDLMRPANLVVPASLSVLNAVRSHFSSPGSDRLPVVDGTTLLGCVSAQDLARIPRERWASTPIAELVQPYEAEDVLTPDLDIAQAFRRMAEIGRMMMPVFSRGQMIGQLHARDVAEHVGRRT